MNKMSVRDYPVEGKRVLVRVDFNVPLDARQHITDDTRIRASLPTIRLLLDRGAKVILMSHLGRPKGQPTPEFSLRPVATALSELLGRPVTMAADCVGPEVEEQVSRMRPGDVLLLENLRFHKEEEKNDPEFAGQLAKLGDVYVNDAFGSAHRAHASTAGIAAYLPAVAGLLMEREIDVMGKALENPDRPFVAIIGGAKVSDKFGVLANLLGKVEALLIGGGMANTFILALGYNVGQSLAEPDKTEDAGGSSTAPSRVRRCLLPSDVLVADKIEAGAQTRTVPVAEIPHDWRMVDIGPDTIAAYRDAISGAKTVIWNGPMGIFEVPAFARGTRAVAEALGALKGATTIVGGGDSVAAVEQMVWPKRSRTSRRVVARASSSSRARCCRASRACWIGRRSVAVRLPLIAGNWKMNTTVFDAVELVDRLRRNSCASRRWSRSAARRSSPSCGAARFCARATSRSARRTCTSRQGRVHRRVSPRCWRARARTSSSATPSAAHYFGETDELVTREGAGGPPAQPAPDTSAWARPRRSTTPARPTPS